MPRQRPAGLTISDHGYRTARMNVASVFDRLVGRYVIVALSFSPILRIRPCTHACHPWPYQASTLDARLVLAPKSLCSATRLARDP
jgi:hypothetical protein